MEVKVRSIHVVSKDKSPYFEMKTYGKVFSEQAVVVKVLTFSIDPVMRVWLSGAKTNFRVVSPGDVFNCFGLGQVIQSGKEQFPVGSYIWGNTGTTNFLELTQEKQRECFVIDKELVEMYGADKFIYLINNGLAAYDGFEILQCKEGENVLVSTAAGATGILLCYLLKQRKANIIALSSANKHQYLQEFTNHIYDYKDLKGLGQVLRKLKFSKYFDNVGESQLDLALATIENNGTIALCGAIENYTSHKEGGIMNYSVIISKRLKLEGVNFSHLFPRASEIFALFKDAKVLVKSIKLESFGEQFDQLFKKGGSIVGKIVVNPHLE